ncbi:MAG: branched chain amino acid aminotransferase [Spirochaetae bacterium HGW-Spirochaetae-3]|jgi:branched-chain amino acid aminotransferase|nr:MAG: branched chain amino acid aminotransferase [Spirochaetae bacterium HGW-Spirochaetae-3]
MSSPGKQSSRFESIVIPGSLEPTPLESIVWEKLGFSVTVTPFMGGSVAGEDGVYEAPTVVSAGVLRMPPQAGALNYGQALFEGMKARRGVDGRIRLFRVSANAARMASGADRLMLAPPTEDLFRKTVVDVVRANVDYVPPLGKGALYIRPLLVGSGMTLAPAACGETTFVVYVQPVGSYFKGLTCIGVKVEDEHQRAAARGTGWVKAAGNYAPCFQPTKKAKADGFADLLFLDHEGKRVEEVGSANFAMVKGGALYVADSPSILKGITRDSVMRVARERLGVDVVFAPLELARVLGTGDYAAAGPADEAFCMGTAAVISPIGSMRWKGKDYSFGSGAVGPVTTRIYDELDGIQTGRLPDSFGWTEVVS